MSHRDGAATLTPSLHMLVLHATCRWGCAATRGNQITFSCAILLRGIMTQRALRKVVFMGCMHERMTAISFSQPEVVFLLLSVELTLKTRGVSVIWVVGFEE